MEKPKEEQEKEQLQKEEQEQKQQLEAEEKLQEKTDERLKTVFEDEQPLSEAEAEDDPDSPTPEPDDKGSAEEEGKPDDSTPSNEKEDVEKKTEEKEGDEDNKEVKDEKDEKEDTPQLPDAYYRAAKHNQWSDEEIKEFFENNSDLALKTFGNMLESMNRSSQDFSAIGRARKEQFAKKQDVQPEKKESEFKGVDIDALRQDGVDEDTLELIKTQNEQAKANYDEIQKIKSGKDDNLATATEDANRQAILREADAIAQTVDGFFGGEDMKNSYGEFYGVLPKDAPDWKSLTPGQKANRIAVVEMMDEILIGAATCGRELSTEDALRRAHLSITDSIREKVIRDGLKAKAKQRSKAITLEPTGTTQPKGNKPQTKAELETVTTDRLNKVFG